MSDFGDTHWPKAAKPHRCEWCGETIDKGEKHAQFKGVWAGEWQNWRMHSECYSAAADAEALSEGFMPYEYQRASSEPR